jgi:hypothetical protein
MRYGFNAMIFFALSLISGTAYAACLPTLGTDNCFRAADPRVQAIEHHYLDAPKWDQARSRFKRHSRTKGLKISPSTAS